MIRSALIGEMHISNSRRKRKGKEKKNNKEFKMKQIALGMRSGKRSKMKFIRGWTQMGMVKARVMENQKEGLNRFSPAEGSIHR